MGKVIISPNIKREKDFININGDFIDQRTKQVIEKKEEDYIPTVEKTEEPKTEIKSEAKKDTGKLDLIIENKIKEKIDDIISKRIEKILEDL